MTETAKKRLEWLDFWRLISALAIIWLHTPESPFLASTTGFTRYAVPFFTASAAFMACRIRNDQGSFLEFVRVRFIRIYLPFLGWSFIYFAARGLASLVLPTTHPQRISWSLLWNGPASHLWFLPFILLATILANLIGRLVSRYRFLAWPTITVLCALAILVIQNPELWHGRSYTWGLSYNTLPALFWGICLSIFCSRVGMAWLENFTTVALGYLVCFVFEMMLIQLDRHLLIENLAGFILLVCCFVSTQNPWIVRIATLGPLAYGIYLSHMLFLEGLQDIGRWMGLPISPINDVGTFLLTAACAILLTAFLKKSRYLSWLAP